jgi:ribose 5-phosphate isomerase B
MLIFAQKYSIMETKLIIGSDHAGFAYKQELITFLQEMGVTVQDAGTVSEDSADYPDFAHIVAQNIENQVFKMGILLCGSGNGVAMSANKHPHVRAGLAWNAEVAQLIRRHNDANILCLPARFMTIEEAKKCTDIFLNTEFEGGRHQRRVEKISLFQ